MKFTEITMSYLEIILLSLALGLGIFSTYINFRQDIQDREIVKFITINNIR